MNSVNLLGRLTKDIEVRYTDKNMAVTKFSIAIDRGKDKDGNSYGADFPSCIAFGKTAENLGKYFKKGQRIAISGRIQTGSYEREGQKFYTTDIIVNSFNFCESAGSQGTQTQAQTQQTSYQTAIPEGFEAITDDDVPF